MARQIILCIAAITVLSMSVTAGTYYIAPNGSDATGDGTIGSPWKSLSKADGYLTSPGDTLYCRGGVYTSTTDTGTWLRSRNGTAANPITIRNYPGETPIFRSHAGSSGQYVLRIYGNYFVVDGLQFKPTSTARTHMLSAYIVSDGSYCIFRNLWFESIYDSADDIYTSNRGLQLLGQSSEVYGCTFIRSGQPVGDGDEGISIDIKNDYHYIHDNHFERGVHDNVGLYGGSYCVIRRNTFRNAMGYGILTQPTAENNLIEFNNIQGCGLEITNNKNPFYNNGDRNIYRYNVGFDSVNNGVGAAVYAGENICVYNNAFWKGQVGGLKFAGRETSDGARDHSWINNVVGKYMQGGSDWYWTTWYADVFDVTYAVNSRSYFHPDFNNQFHNNWIQSYVDGQWESDWGMAVQDYIDSYPYESMSVPEIAALYPTTWSGNISTYSDPYLLDPDNGDFTITDGASSLIDAGRHLTTTDGAGSGTSMTLASGGSWFFWPGDKIAIGSVDDTVVTISTSWTRGANPILLTQSASWSHGEPIYLYASAYEPEKVLLDGPAPDIGPYEFTHPEYPTGDLDGDGTVGVSDLNMILIDWGKSVPNLTDPRSDVDGDGTVTVSDLNYVLIDWSKSFHALTVTRGYGDGTYSAGQLVPISANAVVAAGQFDQWTGDISGIADIDAPSTDLTMPSSDADVTATYLFINYDLTVENGSGSGSYSYTAIVPITADDPPTSMRFTMWVGDTVANPIAVSTTITIPDHDVTVTATYEALYTLTVLNPSFPPEAIRTYDYFEGDVFNINTGAPPIVNGQVFDQWQGDIATIADIYAESTNMTMPGSDATITATYQDP